MLPAAHCPEIDQGSGKTLNSGSELCKEESLIWRVGRSRCRVPLGAASGGDIFRTALVEHFELLHALNTPEAGSAKKQKH